MVEPAKVFASFVLTSNLAGSVPAPNQACRVGPTEADAPATSASAPWITSVDAVACIDASALSGRHISVRDVRVERVTDSGFWIGADGEAGAIFVVPAEGPLVHVNVGELVDVQGEFRIMKQATEPHQQSADPATFVYAYTVRHVP